MLCQLFSLLGEQLWAEDEAPLKEEGREKQRFSLHALTYAHSTARGREASGSAMVDG